MTLRNHTLIMVVAYGGAFFTITECKEVWEMGSATVSAHEEERKCTVNIRTIHRILTILSMISCLMYTC